MSCSGTIGLLEVPFTSSLLRFGIFGEVVVVLVEALGNFFSVGMQEHRGSDKIMQLLGSTHDGYMYRLPGIN